MTPRGRAGRVIHHDGIEILIEVRELRDLFNHMLPNTYVCTAHSIARGQSFAPIGAKLPVFFEAGETPSATIDSITHEIRRGSIVPWRRSGAV
jgi:hypothetical protein